jgi:Tfp pilus assembly protein PilO
VVVRTPAARLARWLRPGDAAQLTGRLIGTREQTLVAALEELEAAGRELDLRFGARALQPAAVTDAPLTRLQVRLPVEGNYRALVIFVRRLEHSRRFLTVDELHLTEREGGQRATLDVSLSLYFRGQLERQGGTRARS